MDERNSAFDEAVQFVLGFANYEKKPPNSYNETTYSLEGFRHLLNELGNPHHHGRIIHIAGTKGKGAAAAILDAILTAHGFRTGLFTSPHLIDIRERIRVSGCAISESRFAQLANEVRSVLPGGTQGGFRTTFEILTAMAFLEFRQQDVDFSIVEVGMGGRLDCTNVVDPVLTAMTPISLDHTDSLGQTIRQIAVEKAGILKPDRPCVVSRQSPAAWKVIRSRAIELNARLMAVPRIRSIQSVSMDGSRFDLAADSERIGPIFLRLPGRFQIENAAMAIGLFRALSEEGYCGLDADKVIEGCRSARWPGRLMPIGTSGWYPAIAPPLLLADGAHNPLAMRRLMESLSDILPGARFTTIIAVPSNKDFKGMIREIALKTGNMIVTRYSGSRALPVRELKAAADRYHAAVQEADCLSDALCLASRVNPLAPVLVTGSLYLIGELCEMAGYREHCLNLRTENTEGECMHGM